MKIAIIGAGFSGVATAYKLLLRGHAVTLYDMNGIGGGASGIAAGLMHPFAGRTARLNWRGHEGMKATNELLAVASDALGIAVADSTGIIRVALSDEQLKLFKECSDSNTQVDWQTNEMMQGRVEGIASAPGIFIHSAVTVNCPLYLQGLWKTCEKLKGKFEQKRIEDLTSIDAERVIITTGAHRGLHSVPLTQVKGQLLEYDYTKQLPYSIISQGYIVTKFGSCLAGSTFEKSFTSQEPDIEVARAELEPKIFSLYPPLAKAKIIGCRSGLRASCQGHLPVIKQTDERTWVLTGMGSKGLLYHALFADELCKLTNAK